MCHNIITTTDSNKKAAETVLLHISLGIAWLECNLHGDHGHGGPGRMHGGPSTATRRTKLKEHTDGYHLGARETRVKGTITGQREGAVYRKPASRIARRRSSVEGVDTAQEDRSGARAPVQYSMKRVLSGERAGAACHGPECSESRRAPVESMAVVQSPWRPWTPTDSHAKEERVHMRGGPAKKRTKLKEHADGYHSGGSRDKSQRNHHRSKEEEQCIGDRQVGPEEEEQCRRSRHRSEGTGVPSKEEEQCRRSRHSSGGQEWC
ncbi:uncharacterized protein UDID_18071 [Ustilago sp. UG-2017a]|nr:uncharacterized protein UDID_18071 [Ustilago sp. UG-2017a]